jgi:hypothetical protein
MQPAGLRTRSVEAGKLANLRLGRIGLATSAPLQLGHMLLSLSVAQVEQKVHSKEQMRASVDSGGRSKSQHSQFGLN